MTTKSAEVASGGIERISPENVRVRESRDACTTSLLGARFSSFLDSRHEEEKTQRDSEERFVVTSECSSCRIENAIFLLLNWFKRE